MTTFHLDWNGLSEARGNALPPSKDLGFSTKAEAVKLAAGIEASSITSIVFRGGSRDSAAPPAQ